MMDSRGQIRLTSQKRSSKSSYSCSQKRQREATSAANPSTAATVVGIKQKNTIDSNTIYIADGLRPDSSDLRKINLS